MASSTDCWPTKRLTRFSRRRTRDIQAAETVEELQVAHRLLVSESKTERKKLETKSAELEQNNA